MVKGGLPKVGRVGHWRGWMVRVVHPGMAATVVVAAEEGSGLAVHGGGRDNLGRAHLLHLLEGLLLVGLLQVAGVRPVVTPRHLTQERHPMKRQHRAIQEQRC